MDRLQTPVSISGMWRSMAGRSYQITQLNDRFVWRVQHGSVTETGIGLMLPGLASGATHTLVDVMWDCHGGDSQAGIRRCRGRILVAQGRAKRIEWDDLDDFVRDSSAPDER
jgi:hypothetical protein